MFWQLVLIGLILGAAVLCTWMTMPGASPPPEPSTDLPRQIEDWRWDGRDQLFDDRTIFKYIDGGAEIYRAYGLKRCLARRFEAAGKPAIVLDLFELPSSAEAFGVFTHDLDGAPAGIGQDSRYRAGWLCLWQNRFYASIYAEGEGSGVEAAIRQLGAAVAERLGPPGATPALLEALPEDGLDRARRRYLHDHVLLNLHYFLANDNLLGLSRETEAVLGDYRRAGAGARLLVIRYPGPAACEAARDAFLAHYLPEGAGGAVVRIENGKWCAAMRRAEHLAVVLESDDRALAETLLREVTPRMAPNFTGGKP